jgi:hypothetical protein
VVLAKSVAHGLRATTVLLAVLPVIALPMLMGGVAWQQAAISVCLNSAAVCLALAAGLLASAFCKSWIRSLVTTMCLVPAFALGLFLTFGLALGFNLGGMFNRSFSRGFDLAFMFWNGFHPRAWDYLYSFAAFPGRAGGPAMLNKMLPVAVVVLLLAVLALGLVVLFAAHRVKRTWQERPPHPLLVWLHARLCQPVMMQSLLRDWMRRKLDRNPIGWLEHRTWSGRIVIWGWLAVMVSIYSYALGNADFFFRSLHWIHATMGNLLLLSMTFSAANSLRRERETRALELLLVSPLSEAQILYGRLRGLWGQFLPSVALFLGGWTWLALELNHAREFPYIVTFVMSFLAVPVIGLFFSLVCKNYLTALVWSVVVALILPSFFLLCGPLGQAILATALGVNLHQRLVQRRFALESN